MIKVVITGRNARIAEELSERLKKNEKYEVVQLTATRDVFMRTVPQEQPRVFVICLRFESERSVNIYNFLSEYIKYYRPVVIVLANKKDRLLFMEYTDLKGIKYLPLEGGILTAEAIINELKEDEEETKEITTATKEPDIQKNEEKSTIEVTKTRILIVENDSKKLMQLREFLKDDYKVYAAWSLSDATDFLESNDVELVLFEYRMPEMGVHKFFKFIKTKKRLINLPVVLISNSIDKEILIKALLELKPHGYILLPISKEQMLRKMKGILFMIEGDVIV